MTHLPHRPRLGEHAMLRRHVVDGEVKLVLHDALAQEIVELSESQLAIALVCDGTRDIGGVMLAAAREGAYRRAAEIEQLIAELGRRGLLADGIARVGTEDAVAAPDRPLEALPGYRFACHGNGSCCATYASVAFEPRAVRRATACAPEVDDADERFFLPLFGADARARSAVSMVNGACAYLGASGDCRVYAVRPSGCSIFPSCYVDDGETVRVSVAVECACVLASVDADDGAPLVAADARIAAQLPTGARISTLPERVRVHDDLHVTRAAVRAWSDAVSAAVGDEIDGVAALWALADAVAAHGLEVAPSLQALRREAPAAAALGLHLLALAAHTADKRVTSEAWRSPRDRTRRLAIWLDGAAQSLIELAEARARLGAPTHARHEAFYVKTLVFGHQLVSHQLSLVATLRDRAIRVLLARAAVSCAPDDPSSSAPLTAVEAMMRGQGLDAYAVGLE